MVSSGKKATPIVTYLYSIIILLVALLLIIMAIWPDIILFHVKNYLMDSNVLLGMGISGALLLLITLKILWSGIRTPRTLQHTLIKTENLGEIHVSLEAINDLIIKASQSIKGVREVKPKIKSLSDGVAVLLFVVINPGIHIPDVTSELQKEVAHYLEEYGGVNVLEVKVVVQSVKSHNKVSRVE